MGTWNNRSRFLRLGHRTAEFVCSRPNGTASRAHINRQTDRQSIRSHDLLDKVQLCHSLSAKQPNRNSGFSPNIHYDVCTFVFLYDAERPNNRNRSVETCLNFVSNRSKDEQSLWQPFSEYWTTCVARRTDERVHGLINKLLLVVPSATLIEGTIM